MAYRPHRSHAFHAPVSGASNPQRRRSQRAAPAAPLLPAVEQPTPSGVMVGLLYGLPTSLLLWAGMIAAVKIAF